VGLADLPLHAAARHQSVFSLVSLLLLVSFLSLRVSKRKPSGLDDT
jgi:hypothetical protein